MNNQTSVTGSGNNYKLITFTIYSFHHYVHINPLNPELNLICYLLALLAHHFLRVSRIRVKSLTLRLLMSYYYYLAGCTTFPHLPAPVEHL
jgi:hypothetical protein